jgi:hypothetical protein
MTLITEFIDAVPFEQGRAKTSMVFVAIRAFQLSFPDWMVGSLILLRPNALVAEIAEVWLGGL